MENKPLRSTYLSIRVTEEEKKDIKREAKKQDRSISNFIMWILKNFQNRV